jgi:branched-chain amino acid transport system ATP-binding protein
MTIADQDSVGRVGKGLKRLLDVRALVVRYGAITAVHGVDLHVDGGEIVAIVGPNGAGKTSLLAAIAGVVTPKAGAIAIAGKPLAGIALADVVRQGIALVPEGRNIFGTLTIHQNLLLGATIRRDVEIAADIERVFTNFPILGERKNQPAGQLSGGEQQQLAIARALLSRPRLLMLDEPSLGLAPTIVDNVYALLRTVRERGVSILVVEQNAARAFAIADRAYVMSHGAFTLSGAPSALQDHDDFDAAYFGVAMRQKASGA